MSELIDLVKKMLARGEELCAQVCCDDWGLDLEEIKKCQ